mmetsp:Transcript_78368/g.201811  ORF Transcript_78368/g.201811 Transcript_78368/m.201811 type:complete len:258 (-) Transcript_78368:195-968(-)
MQRPPWLRRRHLCRHDWPCQRRRSSPPGTRANCTALGSASSSVAHGWVDLDGEANSRCPGPWPHHRPAPRSATSSRQPSAHSRRGKRGSCTAPAQWSSRSSSRSPLLFWWRTPRAPRRHSRGGSARSTRPSWDMPKWRHPPPGTRRAGWCEQAPELVAASSAASSSLAPRESSRRSRRTRPHIPQAPARRRGTPGGASSPSTLEPPPFRSIRCHPRRSCTTGTCCSHLDLGPHTASSPSSRRQPPRSTGFRLRLRRR